MEKVLYIPFEFFDAIDGNYLLNTKESLSDYLKDILYYRYQYISSDTKLTSGEIGCFLSHVLLWKKIINENISPALILEDDIILTENFHHYVSCTIPDYDVIFLGHCDDSGYGKGQVVKKIPLNDSKELSVVTAKSPACTHAYLVTKRGVNRMLNYLDQKISKKPIDLEIVDMVQFGIINAYQVFPTIVDQDHSIPSSIEKTNKS
jgi:glycosyl transferase family 25